MTDTGNALTRLLIILGPTASGKSDLAVRLAETCNGELINADSLQVYQGLDIGTAKPSQAVRSQVPHHLIDLLPPEAPFTAADFCRAADRVIADIVARGKRPIVVGGTGLYLRALIHGLADSPGEDLAVRHEMQQLAAEQGNEAVLARLRAVDPVAAARIHPNNLVRIIRALEVYNQGGRPLSSFWDEHGFMAERYQYLKIGLQVEREELYRRIEARVDAMLAAGLVAEVQTLLAQGASSTLKPLRSIGYKEVCAHLAGELSLAEARALIIRNTRHYAKRQLTWCKREEPINWVEYPKNFVSIQQIAIQFFA
jgi:tRNA dimethylallyltransferase